MEHIVNLNRIQKPFDMVTPLWHSPALHFLGLVAQLVEQCPFKALVLGSSPSQPTIFKFIPALLPAENDTGPESPRPFPKDSKDFNKTKEIIWLLRKKR